MSDTVPEDFFRLSHYDLKETALSAMTCDDEYLYLCIAAKNGGIYKIGTGNGITKAGKVYVYKPQSMVAGHIKMVVIGDTIYRSYHTCDFVTLKTNNKVTLESTDDIELNCPLVKTDSINQKINKCIPLMTDGTHLFVILKTLSLDPIEEGADPLLVKRQESNPKDNPFTRNDFGESKSSFPDIKAQFSGKISKNERMVVDPNLLFPTHSYKSPGQLIDSYKSKPARMYDQNAPHIGGPGFNMHSPPIPSQPPGENVFDDLSGFHQDERFFFESDNPNFEDRAIPARILEESIRLNQANAIKPVDKKEDEPKLTDSKPGDTEVKSPEGNGKAPTLEVQEKKEGQNPPIEEKKIDLKEEPKKEETQEKPAEPIVNPEESALLGLQESSVSNNPPQVDSQPVSNNTEIRVEMEDFLRIIVEGYFTEEREKQIKERWDKVADKLATKLANKIRGSPPQKPPTQLPTLSSSIAKQPATTTYIAGKKAQRAKPKEKTATKPVEPPERDRTGLMSFWLYRYKLSYSPEELNEDNYRDNPIVIELFESFSGLFSFKECARAFKLSQEDIVLAAQWLVEEGEKQRTKKCLNYDQITLIAQGEIDPRCMKSKGAKPNLEEVTFTQSVLQDRQLLEDCIYHEGTILIGKNLFFSADPKDEYDLPDDIMPQILQDRKFVTPDRVKSYTKQILKSNIFNEGKIGLDAEGLDPQIKLYYKNFINISEDIKHQLRDLATDGDNLPILPKIDQSLLEEVGLEAKISIDEAVKTEESKPDTITEKKVEVKEKKVLRGTFICKVGTAFDRQEVFSPRCYDPRSNCVYSLCLAKKNNWIQNPGLIIKSRDPVGYQKAFIDDERQSDQISRAKLFYDGTKEIIYGFADNDCFVMEEQKKYFEKFQGEWKKLTDIKEMRRELNKLLLFINAKRFSMPFKYSDSIESMTRLQRELDSQLKRTTNPEEKKALQSKKSKIMVKIAKLEKASIKPTIKPAATNKTQPQNTEEVLNKEEKKEPPIDIKVEAEVIENKKQFSFCPIGSELELDLLFERLQQYLSLDSQKDQETLLFYIDLLIFWSNHLSCLLPVAKVRSLYNLINETLERNTHPREIQSKLESVMIKLVYFFTDEAEIIQDLLKSAFKSKPAPAEPFEQVRIRTSTLGFNSLNSDKTTLLEKIYLVVCRFRHYDIFNPFNQADVQYKQNTQLATRPRDLKFKLKRTLGLGMSEKELFEDKNEKNIFKLILFIQESIIDSSLTHELILKWKLYFNHFSNLWILFESGNKSETHGRLLLEFVGHILGFIERYAEVIERDNLKNIEVFSMVVEYILCMVNVITSYIIRSRSSSKILADADFFANKNLKIMGTFMKIYKKLDAFTLGKLSQSMKLNNEGLDTNQQTIFETSHPINRGETVKANTLSYPDAIAVVVQLDKRCHSDNGKDFFILHSWDLDQGNLGGREELNINASSTHKVNIGVAYKVTGAMKHDEVFVMVGGNAKLQFEANQKALEFDQSLKKWGYRARSMPLYGYESSIQMALENEAAQIPYRIKLFGSSIVQILNRLTITLIKEIEPFLKGKRINLDEKRTKSFLDWSLFKNGLSSLKKDLFLQDYKQGLKLTEKMKDSISRAMNQSDDNKSRSMEETEKMSVQSKGEMDNEFLQDRSLTELLTRLQSNDEFLIRVIEGVKNLQEVPRLVKSEKMRPKFKKDLQKKWENTENLIILSMLHHSGLLKMLMINVDKGANTQIGNMLSLASLKEQMSHICQKKNDILNKMVTELQMEREFMDTLESMNEYLKGIVITIKKEKEELKRKEDEEAAAKAKQDEEKDPSALNSKDALMAKIDSLQKKYGKKKSGKRSDHIQPKKDTKKKKGGDKKDEKDNQEEMDEKKPLDEVKVELKEDQPEIEPNYYEDLLSNHQHQDQIINILKDGKLTEPTHMEFILKSRGLVYFADDAESNKKELIKHMRSILIKYELDSNALENPYVRVSSRIDERCFFLLKLDTKFGNKPDSGEIGEDDDDDDMSAFIDGKDEELAPPDISRSFSSTAPSQVRKNSNIREDPTKPSLEKRADILGQWISHYKKWKASSDETSSLDSDNCSFLVSIASFLNCTEPIDTKRLEKVLLRIAQRACFRALGLDMIKDFLQFSHDSWLSKYLIGVFSSPFNGNLFENIENLNSEVKGLIIEIAGQNLAFMMNKIVIEHRSLRVITPEYIYQLSTSVENKTYELNQLENRVENYFKQISLSLVEIYSLSSSSEMANQGEWFTTNQILLKQFINAIMEFSLFGISFDSISPTCNSVDISKKYLEAIKNCSMIIFDKLSHKKLYESMLEVLYDLMRKEMGFNTNDETIYFRILHTLNDPSKSNRICFIIDHIKVVILKISGDFPTIVTRIHKLLFEILFLCTAPSVIKSCSALHDILKPERMTARGNLNSFLNTFQMVSKDKLTLFNHSSASINLTKTSETHSSAELIEVQPMKDFLGGSLSPTLHTMILSKMGQMMEPSSDISEPLGIESVWKLVDSPIGFRSPSTNPQIGKQYCIILHQSSETSFINLFKAIFHLDKMFEFNYTFPKVDTWAKFKEQNRSKITKTKKAPTIADTGALTEGILYESYFYKTYQTTIENIPISNIVKDEENKDLPVGWYLNSIRNFHDMSDTKKEKKFGDKRKVTKVWNQTELTNLGENIRQTIEKLVEPKEEDTDEIKNKFLQDWNGLNKLWDLSNFVLYMAQTLNKYGFAKIPIKTSKRLATEFVDIFEAAIQGTIKPVNYDHFSQETKTLLSKDAKELLPNGKMEGMTITVCEMSLYRHFKDIFDKVFTLNHGNNRIIEGLNHNSIISTSVLTGSVKSQYLTKVSLILRTIYNDANHPESNEIKKIVQTGLQTLKQKDINSVPESDKRLLMGILVLIAGWEDSFIAGSEAKMKGSNSAKNFAVIQVPQNTGKLACTLVDNQDSNLSLQYVKYEQIQKNSEQKQGIVSSLDIADIMDVYVRMEDLISEKLKNPSVNGKDETFNVTSWSDLVSIQMGSSLLTQCILRHPETNKLSNHPAFDILIKKSLESLGTPSLKLVYRLFISWENIVDKFGKFSSLIFNPRGTTKKDILKGLVTEEVKVTKNLADLKSTSNKESTSYRLPASSYLECLPRSNPKSSNYKMVRYWEKHIIPKIENFVKSSFSQFQMSDYFEQMRMSLRVLDHIRASVIAFRLCDWGLPNGCFLPDADYDWETIDIEDIEVGSLISIKLEYRNLLISQKIKHLFNLGLEEIVGEVLLVDHQLKYVLALIRDDNQMVCLTLWVPQQCVKHIEYPIDRQGSSVSFVDHWSEFSKRYNEAQTFAAQNILINSVKLRDGLSTKVDTYKVLRWMIISEFNSNLISGWLEYESRSRNEDKQDSLLTRIGRKEPTKLNNLEEDLQKVCEDEKVVDYLIAKIQEEAKDIVSLLNENNYALNMKEKLEVDVGQNKNISPLNIFSLIGAPENSVCSIAVTFDKRAYLGVTSGIKFFSDKKGVHLVSHIFNNQPELSLSNIPPILFHSYEVYAQFYYSVEGVPVYSRDLIKSDLPCVVHGIPYSWTPFCWMIDTLSSLLIRADNINWTPKISSLLKLGLTLSQEIKGPSIIKQMLYKLSTRLVRKMKYMVRKHQEVFIKQFEETKGDYVQALLGLDNSHIDNLMKELNTVLEIETDSSIPNDKFRLYSSYTQDLIELLSTILLPIRLGDRVFKDSRQKTTIHENLINFLELAEFFKLDGKLSEKNLNSLKSALNLENQTKNFVVLTGIPRIHKTEIFDLICKTLSQKGARILSKQLDIYLPVESDDVCSGYATVFIEGWNIPEKEDDIVMPEVKAEEIVEAPPAPEEPEVERRWICPACTLENELASDICIACESAKPLNPQLTGDVVEDIAEDANIQIPEAEIDEIRTRVWHATFELKVKELIKKKNEESSAEYQKLKAKQEEIKEERRKEEEKELKKKEREKDPQPQEQQPLALEPLPEIPPAVVIPDPNITMKIGEEVIKTNEFVEAMLNRTILDEFQLALDAVLESEYSKRKEEIDRLLGVSDKDSLFTTIKEAEPVDFIRNLAKLGLDIWLDRVVDDSLLEKNLNDQEIKEIITLVEKDMCNESRFFSFFKNSNLRALQLNPIISRNPSFSAEGSDESIGFQKIHGFESKFPLLSNFTTAELRVTWEKISLYNRLFLEMLPLINLSSQCHSRMGSEILTLGGFVTGLRNLCLSHIKSTIKTEIMQKTAQVTERTPSIKLQRLTEDPDERTKEYPDPKVFINSLWKYKSKFTFLKAFDQIKKIPLTMLRPEKQKGSGSFVAFVVDLEGENVQGLAGPYRQFFADISSELQPSISKNSNKPTLGMFIPTPNSEHKYGEDRHKFNVNPSANTTYYLQLFETLGVLMGCAIRTDSHFTMDLPSVFWKKIIGEEVIMQDLELIDKRFVENMRILESCDRTQFEQLGIENFVTKLSDNTSQELIPGGHNIKVTFERKNEFIELCIKTRLDESNKQIEALTKGLCQIVPEPYFKIIKWKDLEYEVCGTNMVDFKLLKRNTIYSGSLKEDSDLIRNFWIVLDEMKLSDKLRFIKFCWGQERLPVSDDEYKRTQTRFMIKPSMSSASDQNFLLPKADTCFFNLELPNYSTKESMQEKILLAINFDCDSLNAEIVINEFNDDGNDPVDE